MGEEEEVGFAAGGFTLMGRSSIPVATRFIMRPPRISIAPVGDDDSSGPKMSPYMCCVYSYTYKVYEHISPAYLAKRTGPGAAE